MNRIQRRKISFSPPDVGDLGIKEVSEAIRSGWITTGHRTKLLERRLTQYIDKCYVDELSDSIEFQIRVICLNSATAAEEMNLRILGIRPRDEVVVPAYTYTATASAVIHCGVKVKFVDIQKDGNPDTHMPEIDYDLLEKTISNRTKAIVSVDSGSSYLIS